MNIPETPIHLALLAVTTIRVAKRLPALLYFSAIERLAREPEGRRK